METERVMRERKGEKCMCEKGRREEDVRGSLVTGV